MLDDLAAVIAGPIPSLGNPRSAWYGVEEIGHGTLIPLQCGLLSCVMYTRITDEK